ncbi:AsmA family protein [Lutimonas zeaxanthinifaciens]|uniref:AsmA family protein n=1 Tax=Lutimonas zeaxanthinifaciens TaxID=3060215 RepID=UPI00265CA581|nr:AsmA family protein [Lutimonas sp. YSD2104]WKK66341.1 AsmA family protein [Lutimonas sp. YSD2104]
MRQRILKISKFVGITLVSIVFLIAVAIGIVFQFVLTPEKITPKVVTAINKNLDAELSIDAIELTFFKTFPSFKLELENGFIQTHAPISNEEDTAINDTLIKFDYGVISVNPIAFLNDKIKINKFSFENPSINAYVSPDGKVNWDILNPSDPKPIDSISQPEKPDEKFDATIDIEEISIINGKLIFDDQYSENYATVEGFDMNLSAEYSDKEIVLNLETQSDNVILRKKGNTYTDQLSMIINTDFHVNRKTRHIQVKNALVGINDIEFVANGSLGPNRQEKQIDVDMNLDLKVPSLSTIIDLIPESVFEKSKNYTAEGDVTIRAEIKGIYKKGQTPAVTTYFKVNNGSLAYRDKPNKIDLLEIDAEIYISPQIQSGSHFKINQFLIKGVGTEITLLGTGENLFQNADLELSAKGKIDLESLEKSLPLKKSLNLEGVGDIDLEAAFNFNDLKNQDYGKLELLGSMNMDQITFHNETDSLLFQMEKASVHVRQEQNSTLLTDAKNKVRAGKINIKNLEFKDGSVSSGNLDHLDIKFATTPLMDSTQIATMKSKVLIENGKLNLGDTLMAKLKYVKANIDLKPDSENPRTPSISSDFEIDSTGVKSKGRFFAITKGAYQLQSTKQGNKWPISGNISFDELYGYTPEFPLLLKMPKTKFSFKPGVISLDHAKLEIGNSDIEATGKLYEFGDAFFNNQLLKGELEVHSELLDINEIVQAINEGEKSRQKEPEEIVLTGLEKNTPAEQPKSFVVPKKLDLSLKSNFKEVNYKTFNINDLYGVITIKDQKIDLSNLQMTTMAAKMTTSAAYESKVKGVAGLDFDFKIYDIDLSKLTDLLPVLDTLLPMVDSFEGKVNARMKGNSKIDKNLDMNAASIDAMAHVAGTDLVILSGKTFEKMAKMLFFKNKEKNTIDKLEFAMIFKDKQIEIFPSVVTVDRYKVAIGGHHNLDLTYDYHVSILKSPMPFKAGLDLKGTEEDMDFKITKAKYKHLFSTKERQRKKADSTLIRRKNEVIQSLPF